MKFWSLFRNTEPPSKVHMDIQLSINWRCYWIEWCSDAQSSNERMISGCHHEPFKLGEIICMFTLSCVEPTLQLNLDLSFFSPFRFSKYGRRRGIVLQSIFRCQTQVFDICRRRNNVSLGVGFSLYVIAFALPSAFSITKSWLTSRLCTARVAGWTTMETYFNWSLEWGRCRITRI